MTASHSTSVPPVLVAIDVAKLKHDILVELPTGRRQKMVVRNQLADFQQFATYLPSLGAQCLIAFEPTADYHRCLAYFLGSQGFELRLASSLSVARTREALHNSWDKNDPKDAQVILHLLRTGATQCFYDPVVEGTNDLQELSKTDHQVSLQKDAHPAQSDESLLVALLP
jgi:transposase